VDLASELRDEIVEALRASGAVFAFVFGSRARGDHRSDSDIDIAASWPMGGTRVWEIDMPPNVDLVDLAVAPLELAGRVALEGHLLFDDAPIERVRWLADTRKIWLDERDRFARAHRDFLEAVADG
jgi:uncharacterized protein